MAIQTEGRVRTSVWFSTWMRSGPGCMVNASSCRWPRSKTSDSVRRSLVGSPLTSMNCAAWVTGSKTMMNSAGICSEMTAFSPGGSSSASIMKSSTWAS
ncbi:hypothetical protein D9M70_612080 [compost metagenome]